jgi:hypothetical protein
MSIKNISRGNSKLNNVITKHHQENSLFNVLKTALSEGFKIIKNTPNFVVNLPKNIVNIIKETPQFIVDLPKNTIKNIKYSTEVIKKGLDDVAQTVSDSTPSFFIGGLDGIIIGGIKTLWYWNTQGIIATNFIVEDALQYAVFRQLHHVEKNRQVNMANHWIEESKKLEGQQLDYEVKVEAIGVEAS